MENKIEVSPQYTRAVEIHKSIVTNAQIAQSSLYEMCKGLKEMRDGKLYKEFGYQNFEEYCETEVGIKHSQVYKYISIAETFSENATPGCQNSFHPGGKNIGLTKLYLLSTLSESEREEIIEENDIEKISKRELEKIIKEKKIIQEELDKKEMQIERLKISNERMEDELEDIKKRPIEVAVAEPNEDAVYQEVMKRINVINRERLVNDAKLQKQYEDDFTKQCEMLEKEKKELEEKLRNEYEGKMKELSLQNADGDNSKDVFKAYYTVVYDSFTRLIQFTEKAENNAVFKEKIKALINLFKDKMEG